MALRAAVSDAVPATDELPVPGPATRAPAPEPPSPAKRRWEAWNWPPALVEAGAMAHLGATALVRGIRPPYTYGGELAAQLSFVLRLCWMPIVLMSFALSFGPAGIQASGFLGLFGALDRLGAAYELIVVRELAPIVTALVLAGAAGTAICADLGAREVREELAALKVLAIDPVKSLVVPRLFALIFLAVLFDIFSLLAGMAGAVLVVAQNDAPLGPFFASFFANATPLELGASVVKSMLFGAVIAVVACRKGLTASGGAEGVGRAVNHTVVIAFLSIGAIDYVFTQLLLATNPVLSQVR